MGKRRVGFKATKSRVNQLQNADSSDEENELEAILDDEIDQFNSQKEQALLKKGNKKPGQSSRIAGRSDEEEVYGLNLDSSEGEDDGKIGQDDDDIGDDEDLDDDDEDDDEDEEDDDDLLGRKEYDADGNIPDSRAWGRKAKLYHNTDYVDQDFGGMEGEDAENAQLEEAEAKEIQKRLTAELDESDFTEFIPVKDDKKSKKKDSGKEYLTVSLDSLSAAEKRKLVERQCPEIIYLLEEYREKIDEAVQVKEKIAQSSSEVLKDYYATKYHIMLNYCMNISFYLLQRIRNPSNCQGHPVVKKILQYRRLLDELREFDVKKVSKNYASRPELHERTRKVVKKGKTPAVAEDELESMDVSTMDLEDGEKRKITYEMAKNKGLMPHRKKEQRNPRVKHREKFRKAKIRRKGQVRTARTEKERYGGETSGIKSHVTKSIKLK